MTPRIRPFTPNTKNFHTHNPKSYSGVRTEYEYYNMNDVIEQAMAVADKELGV
jgi:UDP-galactopyranose mutase